MEILVKIKADFVVDTFYDLGYVCLSINRSCINLKFVNKSLEAITQLKFKQKERRITPRSSILLTFVICQVQIALKLNKKSVGYSHTLLKTTSSKEIMCFQIRRRRLER